MAGDSAVGALAVRIGGDATELLATFEKAGRGAKDFGGVIGQLKGQLATLAAALAPAAVIAWVKAMADAEDQAGKTAQKVGMTVEALSELQYAANLADLSNEQLTTGLVQLSKHMFEAKDMTSEAADAFRAMGVEVLDARGNVALTQDVLFKLADKFATIKDGAEKTAIALKLFGKSGAEMIPLLNGGSEGLKQNAEEARKFGVVISTEAAKRAEEFNDNLRRLQAQSGGLAREISGPLIAALAGATKAMVEARTAGESLASAWGQGLSRFVSGSDLQQLDKKITDASERLTAAQNALDSAKYNQSIYGSNTFDDKAVKMWTAEVEKASKQLQALATYKKDFFTDPAEKKRADETPKTDAPQIIDSKAAAAREQEVRDAMHRVRVSDDERELRQIELQNKRKEDLRLALIAAEQDIAAKMAQNAATPMQDDESNQSRDPEADKRQLRLIAMKESLKSAAAIENEGYQRSLDDLAAMSEKELDLIGGRQAQEQRLAAEHQDRLMSIRRQGLGNLAEFNKASWGDQTKHMIGALADMTASAANHNRGMFEINKVASMANAVVKGWEAVQSSYAFGASWGGPVAGAAMAAVAAAATAVNVMAIKNASFGGGVAPSAASTPAPPVTPVMQSGSTGGSSGPSTIVNLHGDFIPKSVLIQLNEELRNGGKIFFADGSSG